MDRWKEDRHDQSQLYNTTNKHDTTPTIIVHIPIILALAMSIRDNATPVILAPEPVACPDPANNCIFLK